MIRLPLVDVVRLRHAGRSIVPSFTLGNAARHPTLVKLVGCFQPGMMPLVGAAFELVTPFTAQISLLIFDPWPATFSFKITQRHAAALPMLGASRGLLAVHFADLATDWTLLAQLPPTIGARLADSSAGSAVML